MISAKVIAHSKSAYTGKEIVTFEIVFPRWILAELNTHKMLSKNSASSRAIPLKSAIEEIRNNTAYPHVWRANQAGMVAAGDLEPEKVLEAKHVWTMARDSALEYASKLAEIGLHKQWANRIIENFSYQKVIITGTEWDNFFWLRICPTAQPEIDQLAKLMYDALLKSTPELLYINEWHTPYVRHTRVEGHLMYLDEAGDYISIEDALKISASCCAQVSYRKLDDSMEKANTVFNKLNLGSLSEDAKSHSSPTEHQGTPISYNLFGKNQTGDSETWAQGITHVNRQGSFGSGNFYDFIQYRHLIPNESCKKFELKH